MSCAPVFALILFAIAFVALIAREIARRVALHQGPPTMPILLLTILITLVVLQGAARLPVLAAWIAEQRGADPYAICGAQLPLIGFGATILAIFAYALTFFLTWKKVRG